MMRRVFREGHRWTCLKLYQCENFEYVLRHGDVRRGYQPHLKVLWRIHDREWLERIQIVHNAKRYSELRKMVDVVVQKSRGVRSGKPHGDNQEGAAP